MAPTSAMATSTQWLYSVERCLCSRAAGSGESGTTVFWTTTPCQLATSGVACLGTLVLPMNVRMGISSSSKVTATGFSEKPIWSLATRSH